MALYKSVYYYYYMSRCFAMLRQLHQIRGSVPSATLQMFVVALVHTQLDWLRVPERTQYKLAVLAYKVLHGDAPRYVGPLTRVDDLPSRRTLCSANTNRLVVPPVKLSTVDSRAFAVVAPRIWNTLPTNVDAASSLSTFRRLLKRFLFKQSYPEIIY